MLRVFSSHVLLLLPDMRLVTSGILSIFHVSLNDRCWLSEFSAETAVLNKQMTIKEAFHRQLHQGSSSVEFCFNMSLNLLFVFLLDHMVYSLEAINKFD